MSNILILDIGKTNIKVHVLDEHLESRFEKTRRNAVVENPLYPHFDVDAIWDWFCEAVREVSDAFSITAISVTTHGATAALVDRQGSGNGLVLPILDYEYAGPDAITGDYTGVRPDFSETRSPVGGPEPGAAIVLVAATVSPGVRASHRYSVVPPILGVADDR